MRLFAKWLSSIRRSTRLRSGLFLIFAMPVVASCIASNQTGPYRPVSIAEDVESIKRMAYPNDFSDFYTLLPGKQARLRNQIVTARMYIADLEYHYYEARLTRELQDEGLVATAVSLGLTGTAALIPVAQTTRLLSGIATGVTGLDKAYNEKELLSNTIQALQTQMRFDRKARAADIQAKMVKADKVTITSITEYPLAMALSDAEAYYQAGTIASALIGLPKTLANAETNAAQAKADSGPNAPAVSRAAATAQQVTPSQVSVQPQTPRTLIVPQAIRESIPSGGPRTSLGGVAGQPGGPTKPVMADGGNNDVERKIPESQFETIQANLCVDPPTGQFDDNTREAIRQAKAGARQSAQAGAVAPPFRNTANEIKTGTELQKFLDARNCTTDSAGVERGYSTSFEKFRFPGPAAINDLRHQLNACKNNLMDSGLFDEPMRAAIAAVKAKAANPKFSDPTSGRLSDKSYEFINMTCIP
jgi:hypothetical protein